MANLIDSLQLGDTQGIFSVPFGTCSTAAATATKAVTLTNFVLETGTQIRIKFTYQNTAANPTLRVNNGTAIPINFYGNTTAENAWRAGTILDLTYDGTNWIIHNGSTASTSYYGIVKLSSSTSSTSTSVAATPSAVKAAYDLANGKMDKSNPTGTGSFSLNRKASTTIGNYSFAEGQNTIASGDYSHAEGNNTTASGDRSHAEGYYTVASGDFSHAEG
jgi:hypothetical protein